METLGITLATTDYYYKLLDNDDDDIDPLIIWFTEIF